MAGLLLHKEKLFIFMIKKRYQEHTWQIKSKIDFIKIKSLISKFEKMAKVEKVAVSADNMTAADYYFDSYAHFG